MPTVCLLIAAVLGIFFILVGMEQLHGVIRFTERFSRQMQIPITSERDKKGLH
jgi:TctA family transporter